MPKESDMALVKLLEDARLEGEGTRGAQARVRPACVRAVRALEAAIVNALGGEKVRGLPMIYFSQDRRRRLFAVRVRGPNLDNRLPRDGRQVLVLGDDGQLMMAWVGRDDEGECYWLRPAEDAELMLEDVEDVARAAAAVLRSHVEASRTRSERYERFERLAGRLEAAVAP